MSIFDDKPIKDFANDTVKIANLGYSLVTGISDGGIRSSFKPLPIEVINPREKKTNVTKNTLYKYLSDLNLPKGIYFTDEIYINFEDLINTHLGSLRYSDSYEDVLIITKFNSILLDKIIEVSVALQKKYIFRGNDSVTNKIISNSSSIFKTRWTLSPYINNSLVRVGINKFIKKHLDFLKNYKRNDYSMSLYMIFIIYMESDLYSDSDNYTPLQSDKYNISMTNYFFYLKRLIKESKDSGDKTMNLYKLLDGITAKKMTSSPNKADIILFDMIKDYKEKNIINGLIIYILFEKILYNMNILKNIKFINSKLINTSTSTINITEKDLQNYFNFMNKEKFIINNNNSYNLDLFIKIIAILYIFMVIYLIKNETYKRT